MELAALMGHVALWTGLSCQAVRIMEIESCRMNKIKFSILRVVQFSQLCIWKTRCQCSEETEKYCAPSEKWELTTQRRRHVFEDRNFTFLS